mmetsp:Transcript_65831/g.175332  ORF Transcript_65831/g.175332 Transcript_65831/m.175332 type:complete len:274 (-) Transcript_65831:3-824(-)
MVEALVVAVLLHDEVCHVAALGPAALAGDGVHFRLDPRLRRDVDVVDVDGRVPEHLSLRVHGAREGGGELDAPRVLAQQSARAPDVAPPELPVVVVAGADNGPHPLDDVAASVWLGDAALAQADVLRLVLGAIHPRDPLLDELQVPLERRLGVLPVPLGDEVGAPVVREVLDARVVVQDEGLQIRGVPVLELALQRLHADLERRLCDAAGKAEGVLQALGDVSRRSLHVCRNDCDHRTSREARRGTAEFRPHRKSMRTDGKWWSSQGPRAKVA